MFTKEQLEPLVASSKSIKDVKQKLGITCHCIDHEISYRTSITYLRTNNRNCVHN